MHQHIEALIFAGEKPVRVEEIAQTLNEVFHTEFEEATIIEVLQALQLKYDDPAFAFEIVEISGGYQFMSKGAFHKTISVYLKQAIRKRLSSAAMETLAIIAYKQPVTRTEIEQIRGVSSDYSLQKLLDKELIAITGRSETVGKPLLYSTTDKFMDYLGLKSLEDLPKLKEFAEPDNSIGEPAPIEEVVPVNMDPAESVPPQEEPIPS